MRSKLDRLKDNAWKTFSQYIRLRDPLCVTHLVMGKKYKSENAGHFWHAVLDFDEDNVNGQCVNCNKWNDGKLAEYSTYLLKKLGKKGFDALDIRHSRALSEPKHYEEYYEEIIKKYKTKIQELSIDKTLDEITY